MKKGPLAKTWIFLTALSFFLIPQIVHAQQASTGAAKPSESPRPATPQQAVGPEPVAPKGDLQITAALGVGPAAYTGTCPALLKFRGHIKVNQPATVKYKFIRSDGADAPVQTLHFPRAGTQPANTTWTLGGPGLPSYRGWVAIKVLEPLEVESNKANFRVQCTDEKAPSPKPAKAAEPKDVGQEPAKATAPKPKPAPAAPSVSAASKEGTKATLPDLLVEDIGLGKNCEVIVSVRNNGPGRLPDEVYTVHKPDSSSVYIWVNGKRWGGGSIWGFDPDRILQNPERSLKYFSKLKISGTATIKVTIDHTSQVLEANETNNELTKTLTCSAPASN